MKKNDFTISVINSLKPISFSYSHQGKEYEKYFSRSSLQHLLKSVNKRAKWSNSIYNNPLFFDQSKNDSNLININIKSSFDYITDLSSLNNIPLAMIKKRKNYDEYLAKMNLFNKLFYIKKEKLVESEFRKKRGERIKKKYETLKQGGENDATLDPGKYYPKFEIIRRRYPVAYLGQPNHNEDQKINFKKTKLNKKIEKNNIITEDNLAKIEAYKKIRKEIKEEIRNNKKQKKRKINEYSTNYKSKSVNDLLKYFDKPFIPPYKINYLSRNRKTNNINSNRKKLFKVLSAENINKIKCPIIFNRMPGRDRKVVIEPNVNEVDYSPNFEFTKPHVPATIFKHTFDCQKFKRYMTGKIIRSYCYTPDKYFVLEINQNKDKNFIYK